MTDIDTVLSKLNPKTAQAFIKASEVETDVLPTPSLGLNIALGGGLGYGRIHTLWGNRSSGKSLMCLGLAREAQKKGESVVWIDAEKQFDPKWARRDGVDPDKMGVYRVNRMADIADLAVELILAGVDLLIIDSMSVLLPESYFVDKESDEMKDMSQTGQIGTTAKNYAQMVNMITYVNKHTCVVIVSQVRNKIYQNGSAKSLMGGEAAEHINSSIIKLWNKPSDSDITGEITSGDLIIKKPIGRTVTWTIDKARGPGMHWTNDYDFYFNGPSVGIDLLSEIVIYGVEYGVIPKSGNWYVIDDERLNGKKAAEIAYLREHEETAEKIYQQILERAA